MAFLLLHCLAQGSAFLGWLSQSLFAHLLHNVYVLLLFSSPSFSPLYLFNCSGNLGGCRGSARASLVMLSPNSIPYIVLYGFKFLFYFFLLLFCFNFLKGDFIL